MAKTCGKATTRSVIYATAIRTSKIDTAAKICWLARSVTMAHKRSAKELTKTGGLGVMPIMSGWKRIPNFKAKGKDPLVPNTEARIFITLPIVWMFPIPCAFPVN